MKKIITIGLISSLSAFLFLGCGAASPEAHSGTVEKKQMTQKKVYKIIKKAGEEDGWSMTEFKNNAMIAERDGETVTVTFDKHSFDLSPSNSSLNSTLSSALE